MMPMTRRNSLRSRLKISSANGCWTFTAVQTCSLRSRARWSWETVVAEKGVSSNRSKRSSNGRPSSPSMVYRTRWNPQALPLSRRSRRRWPREVERVEPRIVRACATRIQSIPRHCRHFIMRSSRNGAFFRPLNRSHRFPRNRPNNRKLT